MSIKRLSVGQIQIYLDEQGKALFSDVMKRDRVAIETALTEDRDFIDRWLDASEAERPRYITDEERELRVMLNRLGKDLSMKPVFDAEFIKTVIREVAMYSGERSSSLTPIQISESIEHAISKL